VHLVVEQDLPGGVVDAGYDNLTVAPGRPVTQIGERHRRCRHPGVELRAQREPLLHAVALPVAGHDEERHAGDRRERGNERGPHAPARRERGRIHQHGEQGAGIFSTLYGQS